MVIAWAMGNISETLYKSFCIMCMFFSCKTHLIVGSHFTRNTTIKYFLFTWDILLWDFTSHETYLVVYFHFIWNASCMRFCVTRDTTHCGILIQMKHILLWVLTSQEINLVVAFHFTRKICICGWARQYSCQKHFSMGHSVITLALRGGGGVHQNASLCDLSHIIFFSWAPSA